MAARPTHDPGRWLCLLLAVFTAAPVLAQDDAPAPERPNIVLIMADDMGWGWMDFPVRLGETRGGGELMYPGQDAWATPNLRAMAENGLLFSRMYSQSAVCSPTRASSLTGRSPERIGITFANTGRLENREVTLAEYAQALGYRTGMFGKWHLGVFTRDIQDANRGGRNNAHNNYSTPLMQGFDTQYATESKTSTFDPGISGLTTDTRYWTGPEQFIPLDSEELCGDDSAIIVREANAFIREAVENDRPFFAVVWLHTPHLPVNLPDNEAVNTPEAFAFAMEDLDSAVGQLRDQLRELGVADDTLVCFTSDNGPENSYDYFDPLRGRKRDLYEGGVRVPGIIEWPERIEPGRTHTPMGTSDYLPTVLDIWGIDPIDDRPLDGQSMTHVLFENRNAPRTQPIYSVMRSQHAIVDNDYKLISTNRGQTWALYNIVTDHDENDPLATTQTLADAYPEARARFLVMEQQFKDWQASVERSLNPNTNGDYPPWVTDFNDDGGNSSHINPPADLTPGSSEDSFTQLCYEREHATLLEPITIGDNTLPAGTVVNSYLLHFDPEGDAGGVRTLISFRTPILAVITDPEGLEATDYLSFTDPQFPTGPDRGIGLQNNGPQPSEIRFDEFGGLDIFLRTTEANPVEQMRILTLSPLNQIELPEASE